MTALTVLQVLPALNGGGVERGVLEIARGLVAAGHRSLVVSAGGRLVDELIQGGSEHFQLAVGRKSLFTLRMIPALRTLIRNQSVDVVDFHSRVPGWVTLAAWKSLPVHERPALISTLHGLHSVSRWSSVMCRGESVICVSQTVREYAQQNYACLAGRQVHVIPRGIDADEFPAGYRPSDDWFHDFGRNFPGTVGRQLMTLPGRITRRKGHDEFLTLLLQLRKRGANVHGLIVGDHDPDHPACYEALLRRIRSEQLQDHVTFTGHRTDLRDIYAASAVVVSLSTRPEAFGRTVAEALSIGTPVVGYNHGGVGEVLATCCPAGAVPAGNLEAATDRVLELLAADVSPAIRADIWSLQRMIDATLDVYTVAANKTLLLSKNSSSA